MKVRLAQFESDLLVQDELGSGNEEYKVQARDIYKLSTHGQAARQPGTNVGALVELNSYYCVHDLYSYR